MSIALVDLSLSALIAVLGTLAGWFWRRAAQLSRSTHTGSRSRIDQAEVILARLHDLAAGVAADVGEHSSQVEAINNQLTADDSNDAAVVVNAVSQLLAANSQMQQQLDSAEEQLRLQAEEIKSQTEAARTDALTGLANRRVFDDKIAALTRRFQDQGTPFAISILDIDHFKKFNDAHGHQVGDLVLQHAAKVYVDAVPSADIVTRFGGEEFAVIHPATSLEEASRRADAIRKALDDSRLSHDGKELHVTASLGVALVASGEKSAELIERADAALYAAKEGGRNRTYWNDGSESHPFETPTPASTTEPTPEPEPQQAPEPVAKTATPEAGPTPGRAASLPKSLLDRSAFLARLSESLEATQHGAASPTIFFVQPDQFQEHLEEHGGDIGNRLLDAIATVLLAITRRRGAVARFDAQTFAVLTTGYDPVQAMTMAEQIRKLSQQCPLPTPSGSVGFTLSIGTAQAGMHDDADDMIARAETALDTALSAGGDCCFFRSGSAASETENVLTETNCTT